MFCEDTMKIPKQSPRYSMCLLYTAFDENHIHSVQRTDLGWLVVGWFLVSLLMFTLHLTHCAAAGAGDICTANTHTRDTGDCVN